MRSLPRSRCSTRFWKSGDPELADRVRAALKMPQQLQKRGGSPNRDAAEAKAMAEKSLKAGYLKDALKYLTVAQESDPLDFSVMLKLASTYNHDARRPRGHSMVQAGFAKS